MGVTSEETTEARGALLFAGMGGGPPRALGGGQSNPEGLWRFSGRKQLERRLEAEDDLLFLRWDAVSLVSEVVCVLLDKPLEGSLQTEDKFVNELRLQVFDNDQRRTALEVCGGGALQVSHEPGRRDTKLRMTGRLQYRDDTFCSLNRVICTVTCPAEEQYLQL